MVATPKQTKTECEPWVTNGQVGGEWLAMHSKGMGHVRKVCRCWQ